MHPLHPTRQGEKEQREEASTTAGGLPGAPLCSRQVRRGESFSCDAWPRGSLYTSFPLRETLLPCHKRGEEPRRTPAGPRHPRGGYSGDPQHHVVQEPGRVTTSGSTAVADDTQQHPRGSAQGRPQRPLLRLSLQGLGGPAGVQGVHCSSTAWAVRHPSERPGSALVRGHRRTDWRGVTLSTAPRRDEERGCRGDPTPARLSSERPRAAWGPRKRCRHRGRGLLRPP